MLPFVYRISTLFVVAAVSFSARAQYQRVEDTITLPAAKVVMYKTGFPAQFYVLQENKNYSGPIVTEQVHFHVSNNATHKDTQFTSQQVQYGKGNKRNLLQWHAVNSSPVLEMKVDGSLQKNNTFQFAVTFTAQQAVNLDDIKLHLPLTIEKNHLVHVSDKQAGLSDTIQWKWDKSLLTQDGTGFSISDHHIRLTLTEGHSKQSAIPTTWANDGNGGIWVGVKGKSLLEEANTGKHVLAAGDSIVYHFSLTLLPAGK